MSETVYIVLENLWVKYGLAWEDRSTKPIGVFKSKENAEKFAIKSEKKMKAKLNARDLIPQWAHLSGRDVYKYSIVSFELKD